MKKLSYSSLLIFCAVLTQGITDLLDENIDESTMMHIRQKRVIRLDKDGRDDGRQISLQYAPYIVNIQKNNITECAGTILSTVFVLVLRSCVYSYGLYSKKYTVYTILSGSESRNSGSPRTIRRSIKVEPNEQLALIEISPHFNFEVSSNRPISLFLGALPQLPDTAIGIFSGWGCTQPGSSSHQRVYPVELMQVRLPIIQLAECMRIYWGRIRITDENICTLDETKRRGTCYNDEGGPLVVMCPTLEAYCLLGVSHFRGKKLGHDPDVFINLNHERLNQWITQTIQDHVIN